MGIDVAEYQKRKELHGDSAILLKVTKLNHDEDECEKDFARQCPGQVIMDMNLKTKMTTQRQIGRTWYLFAGYLGDQIKAAVIEGDDPSRRLARISDPERQSS